MKTDFRRRTKIVGTIGPACETARTLERLLQAGLNVARINLSHGETETHIAYIRTLRAEAAKLGQPLAILLDLPGPRYRTGDIQDGQVMLRKGSTLLLTTRKVPGDAREVSLNLPNLVQDVKPGDELLLDDGMLRLRVRQAGGTDIETEILAGGPLKSRRGIAAPGVRMTTPFITEQTRRHIDLAVEQQADYIALSFVSNDSDVLQVKEILARAGCSIPIISKIERREAVPNLDAILKVSEGIMVARGDLGIEVALEKVPLIQKEIIRKCNRIGKPAITATQMLESMIKAPSPTRAEVADVANAILDGTDAVMLSAETAVGRYPVQAVKMMARIAIETEGAIPPRMMTLQNTDLPRQTDDAISYSACHTAQQLEARAILAFTESGSTAWRVCKYRPRVPILAFTPDEAVRRCLALAWGVYPYREPTPANVDEIFSEGRNLARQVEVAKEGELVVITGGVPVGVTGTTNMLKVEKV